MMGKRNGIAIVAALAAMFLATDAEAYVCARGPVRAGCVSRYGAVGVRRAPYARGVVVVRHPVRRGVVVVR